MPAYTPQLIASAWMLLITVSMVRGARRYQQTDPGLKAVPGVMLLILTWLSVGWREGVLCCLLAAVLMFTFSSMVGLVVLGLTAAIAYTWPGMLTIGLCGLMVLLCLLVVLQSRSTVRRIERTARMVPGERSQSEVLVAGHVRIREPQSLPGINAEIAMWRCKLGDVDKRSEAIFEVETDAGLVLLDPRALKLDSFEPKAPSERDAQLQIAEAAGIEPPADASKSLHLHLLESGAPVTVIGTPEWKRDAGGKALYRNQPMLPIFGEGSTLHAKSLEQRLRDERWDIINWGGYAAAIGALVALQLLH